MEISFDTVMGSVLIILRYAILLSVLGMPHEIFTIHVIAVELIWRGPIWQVFDPSYDKYGGDCFLDNSCLHKITLCFNHSRCNSLIHRK